MNIRVHIDRLVLHGIDVRDRRAFQSAIQGELARLFAQGRLPDAASFRRASLSGPAVEIPAAPDSRKFGAGVARSVYRAMGGQEGRG